MTDDKKELSLLEASPDWITKTARLAAALNPNWQQVCHQGDLPSPANASGTVEFFAHAMSTLSREKEA